MAFSTWRGHKPAVRRQTGSIAGNRSAWAIGRTWSGCGMVMRPLNASSLPETSILAPGGIRCARSSAAFGLAAKNTSSAEAVASFTTTRHGCRGVAGGSCRTTSISSVATVPGWAWAMVGRGRRSTYEFGEVEQQVDHPLAAGRLGDQRCHRRDDAPQRGQRREQWGEGVWRHGTGVGEG